MTELEEENAELKEKIEVLECDNYNANCNLNLITDQLIKAKDTIKALINIIAENITVIDTEQKGSDYKQAIDFIKE